MKASSITVRRVDARSRYRLAADGIVDWHESLNSTTIYVKMSRATEGPILILATMQQMAAAYATLHTCPIPSTHPAIALKP